jgi:signal transduction histidine kinase
MSHELRTPLNSMLAVSALLLDDRESRLAPEAGAESPFRARSAAGVPRDRADG